MCLNAMDVFWDVYDLKRYMEINDLGSVDVLRIFVRSEVLAMF